MAEKENGGTWTWLGIESYVIDPTSHVVKSATAYRSSGHHYRLVELEADDKVDQSVIGDEPDTFESIGVASVYSEPSPDASRSSADIVTEIYANEDGSRWTALELLNDVTESQPDD